MAESLDNIFDNLPAAAFGNFSSNVRDKYLSHCEGTVRAEISSGGPRCKWEIPWSFSLPELFWRTNESEEDEPAEILSGDLAILVYDVELKTEPGAFDPDEPEFYTWTVETPCRRMTFTIEKSNPNDQCYIRRVDVSVRDAEFRAEQDRIRKLNVGGTATIDLRYLLPGALYKIHWYHA